MRFFGIGQFDVMGDARSAGRFAGVASDDPWRASGTRSKD